MLKVRQTFLKYFGVWVQIWSCLVVFILFITRDREVISSSIVFVCLFGKIPTIWIRFNDTAQTIVCRFIGGDVLFCWLCAMHSWRHWWRHQFKKLFFLSTSFVEYQGELDSDKNYFNQVSYHLSQSSNYYCEDSFNKCMKYQFFNKHQFGFRDKHSTFMALIIRIENVVNAIDNGKCAAGIFLDIQKILIPLIIVFCWRKAFDYFSSDMYLHNRQQLGNYCGCKSDLQTIKCGVPQGSILGPLLFLLYINNWPQVSAYFMPILFADDTNLFATGYCLNYIVSEINKEIANIYAWVKANKLSLNIDKTNFMLFIYLYYWWKWNYGSDWNQISGCHHWI